MEGNQKSVVWWGKSKKNDWLTDINGLEDWNFFHFVPFECLAGCASVGEFHLLTDGQILKTQSVVADGSGSV